MATVNGTIKRLVFPPRRVRRKENPATEGDTLWVNYSMRRFSSRSMAS